LIKRIEKNFVRWCADVISSDNFIILDTETTGFDGDIVELSIVDAQGNILYDSLLRPHEAISEGAMKVHNITEAMVSGAPRLDEEWPEISKRIKGKKLIAWNAKFDSGRLAHAMKAHNIPAIDFEWYCAMLEYTAHYGLRKWARLTKACVTLGIDFKQGHRALYDTLATLEVIEPWQPK
jgi:DNA polymerase-3 subunit epsilon